MKETIILSNVNERELLKTLALNGVNIFNVRVFNSENLAKEALIRSGKIISSKQIRTIEQECFVYQLLGNISYFKYASFVDAKNIVRSLNYARKLCRKDEEKTISDVLSDGEFKEKNLALLKIYQEYKNYLKTNNLIDGLEIINYAIGNAKAIDGEFVVFKETPLEPLEQELIKVVSNNNYSIKTIREFANKQDKKLTNVTYANAYGAINEVEYILGYIAKNNIAYEDCVVALLDDSYLRHFINYQNNYNLPINLTTGQDLSLANSFKLLTLIDKWNKQYNATDSLNDLIQAMEFNINKFWEKVCGDDDIKSKEKKEIIKTVGNLRLSVYKDEKLNKYKESISDKKEKDRYKYVERFANELYNGYSYLINTYTNVDNELFENKAIKTICSYIDDYFKYLPSKNKDDNLPQQLDDIIETLSHKKILKEASSSASLTITDLNGALVCVRKHLFICGLNAKFFPGSPSENYLLLDSDLNRFNEKEVKDSNTIIQQNKELLNDVVDNASALDCKIHLSYAGYNLAEIKEENPSSMFFELFKKENGDNATSKQLNVVVDRQHKYFDEDISVLKNIGNKYIEGNLIDKQDDTALDVNSPVVLNQIISPSSAEIFFTCPKRFYLTKILGIVEPEEDDPFKSLPANDEGTLVHECMEDYGNNPTWTKEEFMDNAKKKFDDYFKKRIPIHFKDKEAIKREYLRMVENGYNFDPKDKEVVASEKYVGPYIEPTTGLKFGGIVDRLERLPNGEYRVVDYKTYKEKKNEEYDIETCLQVVIYAYILENENKKIEDCEYRYLRNPMNIKVGYQEIQKGLINRLEKIKQALDTGDFPCTTKKENCTYCKLSDICGKDVDNSNE